MTRENLPELRLMTHVDKNHGYLTVKVFPVEITEAGEIENIHGYPSDTRYGLTDLSVSAQANQSDNNDFYGWDLAYRNLYCLRLRELEPRVKTLRRIERAMEKLDNNAMLGRATDFVTYVGRFAHVIGATSIGRTAEGARSYREGVRWMTVDQMRYWLDQMRKDFQP